MNTWSVQQAIDQALEQRNVEGVRRVVGAGSRLTEQVVWRGRNWQADALLLHHAMLTGDIRGLLASGEAGLDWGSRLGELIELSELHHLVRPHTSADLTGFVLEHWPGNWKDFRDQGGNSLLHGLARHERPLQVAVALAMGADPNARNHRGQTPLHVTGDRVTAATLIHKGADPTRRDVRGHTPLRAAIERLVKTSRRKQGAVGCDLEVVSLVACLGKQGRLDADPHARVLAQRLVRLEAQGLGADGSRDMEDVLDQARRIMAGFQRRKLMRLAHKPKGRKAQNRAM